MKKFWKLTVLLLTVAMLLPFGKKAALAVEQGTIFAVDAEKENLASPDEATDHVLLENYGYISLKPVEGVGRIIFKINTEKAGTYNLIVEYTAKEGTAARKMDVFVNDVFVENAALECAADWDTFVSYQVSVELTAGDNKVVIATPSDYDNSAVKTPNIYALHYALCVDATSTTDPTVTPNPTNTPAPTVTPNSTTTPFPTATNAPTNTSDSTSAPVAADTAQSSNNTVFIVIVIVVIVVLALAAVITVEFRKRKK